MPTTSLFDKLSPELIIEIFKLVGKPKVRDDSSLHIIDLEDNFKIHPCYTFCSGLGQLRDCYISVLRGMPPKIQVHLTIRSYLDPVLNNASAGVQTMGNASNTSSTENPTNTTDIGDHIDLGLKGQLKNLKLISRDLIGRKFLTDIAIIGPTLNRYCANHAWIDDFLHGSRVPKRQRDITVNDKAVLKTHVERDIEIKQQLIGNLFARLLVAFHPSTITRLSLFPGEVPAAAWQSGLTAFAISHISMKEFRICDVNGKLGDNDDVTINNLPYARRLMQKGWLEEREWPRNYPDQNRSRRNHMTFLREVRKFLSIRTNLSELELDDK